MVISANSLTLGVISNHAGRINIFYATLGHTVWSYPVLVSNHRFYSHRRNARHLLVYEEVDFTTEGDFYDLEEDKTAPGRRKAS
jgi:hypothetical protein